MALANAGDFIKLSMRLLGALQSGDSPTTQENTDFLDRLNLMIRGWAKKRFLQDIQSSLSFTWPAGTASRTMGPGGDFVTTARPSHLLDAQMLDAPSNITYPLVIQPKEKYDGIQNKTIQGIPFWVAVEVNRTQLTLFSWYVPSKDYTFKVWAMYPWTEYAATSDAIGLPTEYHKAIGYNLAIDIASELGIPPSREVILTASEELRDIKALRSDPPTEVRVASALSHSGRGNRWFNVISGY